MLGFVAPSLIWSVRGTILCAAGPWALPGSRSRPGGDEQPGCLAFLVLGGEWFPSLLWETHLLFLSYHLEMSPPWGVRNAPRGPLELRVAGIVAASTDGMAKARSGENELGRAEVPLIGTVTSNPAPSSLFTVAEREGRRKAAWQDAQSRSPSPQLLCSR